MQKTRFKIIYERAAAHRNYESTRSRKISIKPRVKFTMLLTRGRLQRQMQKSNHFDRSSSTDLWAKSGSSFRRHKTDRSCFFRFVSSLLSVPTQHFGTKVIPFYLIPFDRNGIILLLLRYHRCYIRTTKTEANFNGTT